MHRAVTALAAALLALAVTAALALAQGGPDAPPPAELPADRPSAETLYEDGHGGRFLVGGQWYFRADTSDVGEAFGLPSNPALDGWTPVAVPNAWNATDSSVESQRGTVGWYRKDFLLPSKKRKYDWKLRFESVNYRAKVWLNGVLLGEHEGAYVPFEFPASALNRRGPNMLVIRVDNRRTNLDIPRGRAHTDGRPGGGWWNYGGLLREVYLRRFEAVDLETVRVRTNLSPSRKAAKLKIRVGLHNPTRRRRVVKLEVTVDGEKRRSKPVSVGSRVRRFKTSLVKIKKPRLWQVQAPELYPIRIRVLDGKRKLSGYSLKVGIRDLEVGVNGRLRVNGRVVKLYGASLHEDQVERGAALLPSDRERDMRILRELGATITRAHYPLHPHYLELADRMGLVIYDQVPVWAIPHKGFALPGVMQKSLTQLEAMIRRDWNHPSVFVWSIGNELSDEMSRDQEQYIRRAARLAKRLDPTRLRTLDILGYPLAPPADVYDVLDGLGVNNYFGRYPGPNGQVENRELLRPFLDQLHSYYPDMALFVTEFGAEANRSGRANRKGTYAFQKDLLGYHVKAYQSRPFINGALTWILRDFKVHPHWEGGNPRPEPPWNQKGLVDVRSKRKPAFRTVRKLYKAVRVVAGRVTG